MYYKYDANGEWVIYKHPEGMHIPADLGNTEYQNFMMYLDANNITLDDIPFLDDLTG